MMRQIVPYVIAGLDCIIFASLNPAFGAVAENHNLTEVISQFHDTHMTVEDLAFFWPLTTTTQCPKKAMFK